jgi:alkanesulfonate monooxygenase SsuD/methylene tetrahydromethanopterin reductase-like flavin-dependent oxidoreductase (luciferase family)
VTTLGIVFRPQSPPEQLRAAAQAADQAGLDELWMWEDCFDEGGIAAAAAALAWTQRLRVGIGVLPVPLRNPALAAMEIATLCRMFPGRVEMGFGHGVQDWMAQVGARVGSPMTLLGEYVTAVRTLLAGETASADGRYVRLRDVTLGWPPRDPPALHVAAVGPKTLALAGRLGGGLVLTGGNTPEEVRDARERFDAARAPDAGHGRVTAYLLAVPGADGQARLRAELERAGLDADEQRGVSGAADTVAAAVARWAAAGADAVILQPPAGDDPVAFARFVAEEVRPLLR